jgi:phage terminase large subunit-like protein
MIRLDKMLDDIFYVNGNLKTIKRRTTGTALDVKSFDTSIVTGEIPVLTIIDELHELGKKSKATAVMQQIRGGGITMQGGQLLMITTQSDEKPAGVWETELKKARRIRDGKGGPSPILLPVLYEFPQELQRDPSFWRDQRNWGLLLPNNGRSINPARLIADYENNGKATVHAEQVWASQHLNIEIGVALGDDRWSGSDRWENNADRTLTPQSLLERSEVVTVGIDGGGSDDLLGLVFIGREKGTRQWLLCAHAFAEEKVLERRKDIAPRLLGFRDEGSVTISPNGMENIRHMVGMVVPFFAAGLLPAKNAIGIDPNNAAVIFEELDRVGIDEHMRRKLHQGPALAPALYGMDLKLGDGTLTHDGSALMQWIVSNVKIEVTAKGPMATKRAAGNAKIDPFIAAEQATILMSWNPSAAGMATSPWDDPEFSLAAAE